MPTTPRLASEYTNYVRQKVSVIGKGEFVNSLFNSLVLQSGVGRSLQNVPSSEPTVPPEPPADYGSLSGFDTGSLSITNPAFSGNEFTLEFFMYATDTQTAQAIIVGFLGLSLGVAAVDPGYFNFVNVDIPIEQNRWYHIAATQSYANTSFTLKMYLDGILANTSITTGGGNETLVLATDTKGNNFLGSISNFRITMGTPIYSGNSFTVPSLPLSSEGAALLLRADSSNKFGDATGNSTIVQTGTLTWTAGPISV